MNPKLIPYGPIFFDYHDNLSAVCGEHKIKIDREYYRQDIQTTVLNCEDLESPHAITLRGDIDDIRRAISLRISSKKYQEAEIFDIDGYLVPASKEKQIKTKSSEYSITSQVKKSEKKGEQIVIYVGKKGVKGKSQIFVDPTYGKLTFDQNDITPKDIFVKIEAEFRDGSKATIEGPATGDQK